MEKINVAKLLKDCPSGMELDCTMFENLEFDRIEECSDNFIVCKVKTEFGYNIHTFTKYGCYSSNNYAKCVIFPKGKTTWEGFVPPIEFKDGDILATDLGSVFFLNTRLNSVEYYGCYVGIGGDGSFHICERFAYKECCGLAYEKEKQKLFQAIKDNGYKWNPETKTLEKLVTDKFDITTLKPFDKVLVRDSYKNMWCASIFSHTWKDKYFCIGAWYNQCIPYEANKELLGTTNDCGLFYKNWEEE